MAITKEWTGNRFPWDVKLERANLRFFGHHNFR